MKIGPLRIIWMVLALLAAFVIFVECIAKVGGGSDSLPKPQTTTPPAATPVAHRASPAAWLVVDL